MAHAMWKCGLPFRPSWVSEPRHRTRSCNWVVGYPRFPFSFPLLPFTIHCTSDNKYLACVLPHVNLFAEELQLQTTANYICNQYGIV